MGKVVGVLSLKGGVGKTSSVVSIGASLAKMGKKVLLVDGNLSAPNLGLHLDVITPVKTLHHVLAGEEKIDDVIYETHGLDIVPASLFHNLEVNPLKLKNKIRELKDKYDVILIDSSPSLDDETLGVMMASDELLVVTTPDFSTLSMTLKSVKSAKEKGTPITGLILNKVHNNNFELSLEDIEKTSDVPVMAVIPHDINIIRSQAQFVPSTYIKPNSQSNVEYNKLAHLIVGEKYNPPKNIYNILNRFSNPQRQEINRQIFYNSIFN